MVSGFLDVGDVTHSQGVTRGYETDSKRGVGFKMNDINCIKCLSCTLFCNEVVYIFSACI